MTTLIPRSPYTDEELSTLYPVYLELQQVQVLLRHGERTPVSARFKNTGLPVYWPYCQVADHIKSATLAADSTWDTLTWQRKMEKFGTLDSPTPAIGPSGVTNAICQPGELTQTGRQSTLALGYRMRQLYVNQLGFLPPTFTGAEVSLRSTPIPRALESVQQVFTGLYAPTDRTLGLPPIPIVTRSMSDETLFPNDNCKRLFQLSEAFADRAAKVFNDSPEMAYINKKIGKWMPPLPSDPSGKPQRIQVDSHPRLSGIMDTTYSTLAHGPATRLPSEFYDPKVLENIDRICTTEWFQGYEQSAEYRKLGIGALLGDLTQRMVERITPKDPKTTQADFKLSLAGCHDTTLAASLAALGGFDVSKDKWPPYTSSIAFELFKRKEPIGRTERSSSSGAVWPQKERTWWSSLFGQPSPDTAVSARTPLADMAPNARRPLDDFYVRVRYNDRPVTLPYCRTEGRHLDGDESFCTLTAFKSAVDSFTPRDWKEECKWNLGEPAFKLEAERPPGL